jgi:acetyl esterase/lipase
MDVKDAVKRIVVAVMWVLAALALSGCASDTPPAAPPSPPSANSKLGTIESNITYCTGAGVPQMRDIYYPIDPNRIGVTGTSSGGYLAALIALSNTNVLEGTGGWPGVSSRVRAAVVEYGADMDLRQPNYSAAEVEGRINAFPQPLPADLTAAGTPILHVSSDDPPFMFFHGEKDMLVDRQDNFDINNALRAVGVQSSFTLVLNGVHGWDSEPAGPINPSWPQILQLELNFFNTYLKN